MLDALVITVFAPAMRPVLECICGRCAAEDHFFTCDHCERVTPWCRVILHKCYDVCVDCAVISGYTNPEETAGDEEAVP